MGPLSPADLLRRIRDHLEGWAGDAKARLVLSPDARAAMEELFAGPEGLICALHWAGETPPEEQAGPFLVVTHRVAVTVGFTLPPTARKNAALVDARGARPPLLDRVAAARDRVRALLLPEDVTNRWLRYGGCDPVEFDGEPLSAYRMTFEVDAALPEVEPEDVA